MALKLPPPPPMATGNLDDFVRALPAFNRWLLELTSILAASGGIDPNAIDGYQLVVNQVATNAADIIALQGTTGGQALAIAALQGQVAVLTAGLAAANASITTLSARSQVFAGAGAPGAGLGVVNDWYANVGGGVGARIYIKTAPAVWTPFPF
jgi:hypothetical protein